MTSQHGATRYAASRHTTGFGLDWHGVGAGVWLTHHHQPQNAKLSVVFACHFRAPGDTPKIYLFSPA